MKKIILGLIAVSTLTTSHADAGWGDKFLKEAKQINTQVDNALKAADAANGKPVGQAKKEVKVALNNANEAVDQALKQTHKVLKKTAADLKHQVKSDDSELNKILRDLQVFVANLEDELAANYKEQLVRLESHTQDLLQHAGRHTVRIKRVIDKAIITARQEIENSDIDFHDIFVQIRDEAERVIARAPKVKVMLTDAMVDLGKKVELAYADADNKAEEILDLMEIYVSQGVHEVVLAMDDLAANLSEVELVSFLRNMLSNPLFDNIHIELHFNEKENHPGAYSQVLNEYVN